MRHHAAVTTLSWIPSEAVSGLNRAVFDQGVAHYDAPPPDTITDLAALRDADAFRFANHLSAWVELEGATIVDAGYDGGCVMGSTTVGMGSRRATFAGVPLPPLQQAIANTGSSATFMQTVGGRAGLPAPRRVNHPPFVQFEPPTVWTTLGLTIHADGRSEFELAGASAFPRHWVYDDAGHLAAKAGLADFKDWWRHSFAKHTPWGDQDSPALVTAVETALERDLADRIMRGGAKPSFRRLRAGAILTEQGDTGRELFLLLNGVLSVEVDGETVAEVGPGAILGERAGLEGGRRTSTMRAKTKVKVAVACADQMEPTALAEVSSAHRRESAG